MTDIAKQPAPEIAKAAPAQRPRKVVRQRRRSIWRDLASDPVRKLIALALATMLWVFLDNQITQRITAEFKLIGERSAKDTSKAEIHDSHVVVHPPDGYRIVGFRNHLTNEETSFIKVAFEAPKHEVKNALARPGLFVHPREAEINPQTNTFVFDKDELQASDPVVANALREMDPKRIDVVLERVDEKRLALDRTAVKVIYPDSKTFPDFPQRVRMEAAVFAPQQITLRGPRSLVSELVRHEPLFTLDLSHAGGHTEPKLVAELQPIAIDKLTIDDGPVTITVPLEPRFDEHVLMVPVWVDQIGRSTHTDDFEYDPTLQVTVLVSGKLASVLSRMSATERDAWTKAKARVVVGLGDDWRNETQVLFGTLMLMDPEYERGRHYRTEGALSVKIRPKAKRE